MTRFITALLLVLGLTVCAQANLINNPGFDGGGAGWGTFGNVGFANFFGNPGEHAVFFADNNANSGGIFQTGIPGTPGTLYQFSIDASFEASYAAHTTFGLEFYQADDATLIGSPVMANLDPSGVLGARYFSYSMRTTSPAGTAFVRPIFRFDTVVNAQGFQEAATWDNAILLPEPASAAIMLGVGAWVMSRRR